MSGGPSAARLLARPAALALAGALVLTGCGRPAPAPTTAAPTGSPVTVTAGQTRLEQAVAAVVERHLRHRGHPVQAAPEGASPWTVSGEGSVAVVDTLRLALEADPAGMLPAPTAAGSATGAPAAPSVPASGTASPSPLPLGRAPRAGGPEEAERVVEAGLARAAAGVDVALPPGSAEASASPSPKPTLPGREQAPEVLASSPAVLQLGVAVTAATAARGQMDSMDDLNGHCVQQTVAVPTHLGQAPELERATSLLYERLGALAGCRPASWSTAAEDVTAPLIVDEARAGLVYTTDPELDPSALVLLGDATGVLPSGRIAALAQPEALDADAQAALKEVLDALDAEALTVLARVTSGPDALSAEDAAQYWLVTQGLEVAPEGWIAPQGSWF